MSGSYLGPIFLGLGVLILVSSCGLVSVVAMNYAVKIWRRRPVRETEVEPEKKKQRKF